MFNFSSFQEFVTWFGDKFDSFFQAIAGLLYDILKYFWEGFIIFCDLILWSIFSLCFEPVSWLLGKACFTDFYQEFVNGMVSNETGLPALVSYVSILETLLNWDLILTVLSCGLSATLGIILFKIVVKFIPAIY
jgi:hypothetical protein